MTYKQAFPDFPAADLPVMPDGWQDVSFRQDACPSFRRAPFTLYVNYADPAKREFPESPRYCIISDYAPDVTVVESDDWQIVFEAMEAAFD